MAQTSHSLKVKPKGRNAIRIVRKSDDGRMAVIEGPDKNGPFTITKTIGAAEVMQRGKCKDFKKAIRMAEKFIGKKS